MTEDILDLEETKETKRNNWQNYETLHKESRKICDEAKEKWSNDKYKNI